MYVQTRTEVRTSRPLYIENPTANIITVSVPGRNYGITTQASRVKVTALNNGQVSIKGIGKGGFPALHFPAHARVMMEGERSMSLDAFLFLYGQFHDGGLSFAVVIP